MFKYLSVLVLALNACGDGNFDFSQVDNSIDNSVTNIKEPNEATAVPDAGPQDGIGINPVCSVTKGPDGSNGFLYKPVSDSDGKLVVLFPSEFTEKFQSVKIVDAGGLTEFGKFSSFGNGNRQHWRFSKAGSEYVAPLRIVAESLGGECTWRINDSSIRQD